MSWDSYLNNLVAQSKDSSGTAHVDRCCIIGLDGGAPWTTNKHECALKVSYNRHLPIESEIMYKQDNANLNNYLCYLYSSLADCIVVCVCVCGGGGGRGHASLLMVKITLCMLI